MAPRRRRAVMADDHPLVLDAVTAILTPTFDVVAAVTTGEAAVDASMRLRPDVVVLDISMPGLDGFQTASRLKTAGCNARIVFLSNYAGDDFVLAGMSSGASAFVVKPRVHLDLVAAIDHVLAGRGFVPSCGVLPRWSRPAGRRHDLQTYSSDAFLIDAVMTFFDTALEAGDAIVAIMTGPHRRALHAKFSARGLDVEA